MSGKGYFDRSYRSLLALKQALRKIGPMERT
jgi:hypothetical protein